jgi:methylated-DNA-protein-cysteine methyltransferase related protein
MSPFRQKVIEIVSHIPAGRVMSYGQVALYIGAPRAARQVGWTLRHIGPEIVIPWWRVINKEGRISIRGNFYADKVLQKKLLEAEGIEVNEFKLDIKKYRFVPTPRQLKLALGDSYIENISHKFNI